MAQIWSVIRGDIETQVSGGALSYRVSATNIGAPPKRNLSTRGPFQNGQTFYGFRYDTRVMSLVFFSDAATLSLADVQRDNIYNLWKGIENESVTVKVVRDDGAVRLIDGEIINVIDFPDAVGNRFGASQVFAVQLECHNPFWRKQALTVVPLTINGTTVIPYNGQFPAEPIVNIVGPITDPVLTQVFTGKKLDFTGVTIAAGNNYQIDTRYGFKTVLDGNFANKLGDLTSDSDLADFNVAVFPATGGRAWESRSAIEINGWFSVAYGNGVWVAVAWYGTDRVMRSTNDGVTWSAATAAEANRWYSVAYGNGVWVAVSDNGTNRIMRSTNDGVTWTAVAAPEAAPWFSVAYGNGVWVAVSSGNFNKVMRSTDDGVTWTADTTPSGQWVSVAYGNGVWVAVSFDGTNRIMRSTNNGVTWTAVVAPEPNYWRSVAYGNGVWVAVAQFGTNQVMRSTDNGVTWTAVAAPEANEWVSVAYGNGVWVAVSRTGTNRVMRSTNDGVTWTAVAAPGSNSRRSIAYNNGVWVAVSENGTNQVMRSIEFSQNYTLTGTSTNSNTSATMTFNDLYLGI